MEKKKITRRQFITTVSAGAGTILLSNNLYKVSPVKADKSFARFKEVVLGKSGIKTSLLGMGTGFNGGNRSSAITRSGAAESVIRYAYDKVIMVEVGICSLYISLADSFTYFCRTDSFVLDLLFWYLLGFKIVFLPPSPEVFIITLFIKTEMMIKSDYYNSGFQYPAKVITYELLTCDF